MRDQESNVPARKDIQVGMKVYAVEKRNYGSGVLTEGIVQRILTSKAFHPRGTKVMMQGGTVARVQSLTPPTDGTPVIQEGGTEVQQPVPEAVQAQPFDEDFDLR